MSIPEVSPGWLLPARRLAAYAPLSCAGLRLSKNFPLPCPPLFVPSSVPKAGAKVLPFSHSASTFFNYFSTFPHHADCQMENFSVSGFFGENLHLNTLMEGSHMDETWGLKRAKMGVPMAGRGVFRPPGGGFVVPTWAGFGCLGRTMLACVAAGSCGGGLALSSFLL